MPAKSHGYSKTRLYRTWCNMKGRCYRKSMKRYERYGGRGIVVCDEWKNSFETFMEWALRNGYTEELTLDRIDNDGNYCPDNCRWISNKEQQSNKSVNHLITYKGKTRTITQWAEELGISAKALEGRLHAWNDVEKAIETPVQKVHFKDLRGYRFGRLTVIDFAEHEKRGEWDRSKYFYCICDCGKEYIARGHNLLSGSCKSCGCLVKDKQKEYWEQYRKEKAV